MLFHISLTLADYSWSQVINFLRDIKSGRGYSPMLCHLSSNVQQMAVFIISYEYHGSGPVVRHLWSNVQQMALFVISYEYYGSGPSTSPAVESCTTDGATFYFI